MSGNNEKDPFPMTSEAAKKLMTSNFENSNDWKESATTTDVNVSTSKRYSDAERGTLTGRPRKSSKYLNGGDDSDDDDDDEDELIPTKKSSTYYVEKFFKKLMRQLYGDMDLKDLAKSLTLSATLFFLIGGYWLLRSLKDPVLTSLCGVQAIPKAKMLSVVIVLGVVTIYNKCIDFVEGSGGKYEMHHLFYAFGTFYFFMFAGIAYLLTDSEMGLANAVPSESRVLGWVSYCTIESFGSVMVSLFWSFVNSNVSLEAAKSTYGFIVAAAQVGSIIGPTIVTMYSTTWGIPTVYFVGSLCMLMLQGTMYTYISVYGTSTSTSGKKKKDKAGVLEGLHLFMKYNYIKGIFAISCLFMIIVTIIDYTLKVLARDHFDDEFPCQPGENCFDALGSGNHSLSVDAQQHFAQFMGMFGQATNTLSFLLSLLGTNAVIRFLGLKKTLLLFPSLCLCVIMFVRFNPSLYVAFGAMMLLKACSYALNNPTKELLYQPTSSAVKYKAKSWIDIFGARGSKALGSVVTNYYSYSAVALVSNGSLVGIIVAVFLIWNASFMGKKFEEYTNEDTAYIVGGEDDVVDAREVISMEFAIKTDDEVSDAEQDTSCGVEEEGQNAVEESKR